MYLTGVQTCALPISRPASEAKIVNVLVKVVGAHLESELDGGYVAGVLKCIVDRDNSKMIRLVIVNNASACHLNLAALAVDHVIRMRHSLIERSVICDKLERRAGL